MDFDDYWNSLAYGENDDPTLLMHCHHAAKGAWDAAIEACALALEDEARKWEQYMETKEAKDNEKEGSGCSGYMSQARADSLHDAASEIRMRSNACGEPGGTNQGGANGA